MCKAEQQEQQTSGEKVVLLEKEEMTTVELQESLQEDALAKKAAKDYDRYIVGQQQPKSFDSEDVAPYQGNLLGEGDDDLTAFWLLTFCMPCLAIPQSKFKTPKVDKSIMDKPPQEPEADQVVAPYQGNLVGEGKDDLTSFWVLSHCMPCLAVNANSYQ